MPSPATVGERKHVTVLFSDLSGYTALSERLDPEEIKDLTRQLFQRVSTLVAAYEGHVEQIRGDGILALFGVPKIHEDDAVRAIKTAREIHHTVERLGLRWEGRTGCPLEMHTGIDTGLVVTGQSDTSMVRQSVAGKTVNLAARLSDIAPPGEIYVGLRTQRLALRYFQFKALPPTRLKGKSEPIPLYRVSGPIANPVAVHRHVGLRAQLIGRKAEIRKLKAGFQQLAKGRSTLFTVFGEAGTGKSRLIHEFKSSLNARQMQWIQCQAYAHSQKVPYHPLTALFHHLWGIEEGDGPDAVRKKLEAAVSALTGGTGDTALYIGGLLAVDYPQPAGMSPELWQRRLHGAFMKIMSALAAQSPTVLCLEDLHWADGPTVGLFRSMLGSLQPPLMVVCTYRPTFRLLNNHQRHTLSALLQEIRLGDLSPTESQDMMESLLDSRDIPWELRRLVRERAQGNPFYLEEMVNALVESGTLVRQNGGWDLVHTLQGGEIPSTVRGVIAARLDRLEPSAKRILQEAAVIGRTFVFEILKHITSVGPDLDRCIDELVRIDLIHTRTLSPAAAAFSFKHVLTQEVAYKGMLRKERREIHMRIARIMETLFSDRLSEFFEVLAYHYDRAHGHEKALEFLIKSGEKGLRQYALASSHHYFKSAFDQFDRCENSGVKTAGLKIDLINRWAFVYYYRGHNKALMRLLQRHQALAESLDNPSRQAMFFAWLGCVLWHRGQFRPSRRYLLKALNLAESARDDRVSGYACAWLSWVCTELGDPNTAIEYAQKAHEIHLRKKLDPYIYFNALGGMGYAWWHMGDRHATRRAGETLLTFGEKHANLRSMVLGHCCLGWSHLIADDPDAANHCFQQAVAISTDPWYRQFPKLALCYGYALSGQVAHAEKETREIMDFSRRTGSEFIGEPADFFNAFLLVSQGEVKRGIAIMEGYLQLWAENGSRLRLASCAGLLGRICVSLVQAAPAGQGSGREQLMRKAAQYLDQSIRVADTMHARGVRSRAVYYRGLLAHASGDLATAHCLVGAALETFQQCGADALARQARRMLSSLTPP